MNFKVVLEGRGFKPNFSVKISDIADVQIGAAIKRGDGSFNGQKAVIVMINKQPQADTPTVTRAIEAAMSEIKAGLPKDIKVTLYSLGDSHSFEEGYAYEDARR